MMIQKVVVKIKRRLTQSLTQIVSQLLKAWKNRQGASKL